MSDLEIEVQRLTRAWWNDDERYSDDDDGATFAADIAAAATTHTRAVLTDLSEQGLIDPGNLPSILTMFPIEENEQ